MDAHESFVRGATLLFTDSLSNILRQVAERYGLNYADLNRDFVIPFMHAKEKPDMAAANPLAPTPTLTLVALNPTAAGRAIPLKSEKKKEKVPHPEAPCKSRAVRGPCTRKAVAGACFCKLHLRLWREKNNTIDGVPPVPDIGDIPEDDTPSLPDIGDIPEDTIPFPPPKKAAAAQSPFAKAAAIAATIADANPPPLVPATPLLLPSVAVTPEMMKMVSASPEKKRKVDILPEKKDFMWEFGGLDAVDERLRKAMEPPPVVVPAKKIKVGKLVKKKSPPVAVADPNDEKALEDALNDMFDMPPTTKAITPEVDVFASDPENDDRPIEDMTQEESDALWANFVPRSDPRFSASAEVEHF